MKCSNRRELNVPKISSILTWRFIYQLETFMACINTKYTWMCEIIASFNSLRNENKDETLRRNCTSVWMVMAIITSSALFN